MIHYDRISASEDIGINKTTALKEYVIRHFWYCLI